MAKTKIYFLMKNFSYTFLSNIVSLAISSLVILIVPKVIGIEDYGYFQLYLFYASYVGFLHFGWNDGIYLRYGGEEYRNLNKNLFFSQFWMLFITQVLIGFLVYFLALLFSTNGNTTFIVSAIGVNLVVGNSRGMLIYILQATGRLREYSISTILDRIIYMVLILLFLVLGIKYYQIIVFSDLVGKVISFMYTIFVCKDIVFQNVKSFYFNIKEMAENLKTGINLMFANIASSLILGLVKFGIQTTWSVATFGKVSLTLSVSNLLTVFVNALSLVIYPTLRKTKFENLPSTYSIIRTVLMVPLLGILVIYFPLKELLTLWLPQYSDSLEYMALIFPMIIFEGKVVLLTNTYLKTLRKERIILTVNIVTVLVSFVSTLILTLYLKNLFLSMLSIVSLLALRSVLAEIKLSKIMSIDVKKDIVLEALLSIIFILTGWYINSWVGILLYLISYCIYLGIKKDDILNTFSLFKKILSK